MGKPTREKKQLNSLSDKPEKKIFKKAKTTETDDTIFIRNLSFETEEDTLKEFIENNFGETVYCLICNDRETGESKGTAFAKFKDPKNAAKCLREFKDRELQTKFHLDGRNLMIFPALAREKAQEIKTNIEQKKDKRNLKLSKEGFIHPQSEEAKELSKNDLEKRKLLNERKRELLKNLHNFVSDTRLCIHNLPPSFDDERLRQIFSNNVQVENPSAKIVECRIMRNKKGGGQLSTSKGFGFVAFSKSEHALTALRRINNNPSIFTKDKRPIVEFSIENLVALNKKKTRLVNSQRKNLALQEKSKNPEKTGENGKKLEKRNKKKRKRVEEKVVQEVSRPVKKKKNSKVIKS